MGHVRTVPRNMYIKFEVHTVNHIGSKLGCHVTLVTIPF